MSQLIKLHEDCGQSPWLDNITRQWINSGEIRRWIERGVRGVTSNPTIFKKAMESADYDEELAR
ncbi:transaldolase family protein, partial [Candidatus Neomicrothrix sp.]